MFTVSECMATGFFLQPHASHKLSSINFRWYRLAFVGMMLQHTLQAKDFILFGKCNLQVLPQKDLWLSPFEIPSIHPSIKAKTANLYALLTMNFPLEVYTHTSLSSGKQVLNRILRLGHQLEKKKKKKSTSLIQPASHKIGDQ